ncbi:unnamed protein product, partial [Staurois parvus]
MPKHNSATLTCVSKTVHIITTTVYIQVDLYRVFFRTNWAFIWWQMVMDSFFFLLSKENWPKIVFFFIFYFFFF